MDELRFLHTADLHFSNKEAKLSEVSTVAEFIVAEAEAARPRFAVLAGDTVDEHDGRIRLDSPAARAALSFVERLAAVCPVLIVRGTPSHDRDTPYIFGKIATRFPVHVSDSIEQVALVETPAGDVWRPLEEHTLDPYQPVVCAFSCFPSVEKAWLLAQGIGSIAEANAQGRGLLYDVLAGMGAINEVLRAPTMLVAHGMVTGAQFSTGSVAVGEDLEFGLSDLAVARTDYVALGHVHKHQCWTAPGGAPICYAGSPGRLNFGEVEEKGFILGTCGADGVSIRFVATPARRLVLVEAAWDEDEGIHGVLAQLAQTEADPGIEGADLRFRFSIPEEHAHALPVADVEARLAAAGPRSVKIERRIIPKERQRAAGISRIASLPEKVALWGETVDEPVSGRVLELAAIIEGKEAAELVADVGARLDAPEPQAAPDDLFLPPDGVAAKDRTSRVLAAIDEFGARVEAAPGLAPGLSQGSLF